MLLVAKEIHLHYNHKTYLDNITFGLDSGDIIGLVGRNGTGKTSLLRIIAGLADYDGGSIETKKGVKIGYLPQDFEFQSDLTVQQILLDATFWIRESILEFDKLKGDEPRKHELMEVITRHFGWELERHVENLCENFGVKNLSKKISECSGGESRRVALVCALIGFPDVLILDEPTNHLDLLAIENLEKLLKNYQGAVLLVSHDRYFLDSVATKMWELSGGKFYEHKGNYSKYLENKAIRMEIDASRDYKKKQYLKRELEWVNAGVKARATKDKGRLKRFYELKDSGNFESDDSVEMLLPEPTEQGSRILELMKVSLSVASKEVLRDFDFSFQTGMKIGIVGNNGVGKTTFLNLLLGKIKPDRGSAKIGVNTEFLYFDQKKAKLDYEKTPIDELSEGNEKMLFGNQLISTRKYLSGWLFDKSKQMVAIKQLSGGEKSRLMLAKILAVGGNFLILDEPTNDLDLDTLRILEENLTNFEGTAVIVSHDRYFLNRVCNYIIGIEGGGSTIVSTGNYDDYVSKKIDPMLVRSYREAFKEAKKIATEVNKDKEKRIKKIEKEIEICETKISELEKMFEDPEFYLRNPEKARLSHKELTKREFELERLMTEWEKSA
jgi:ABC transport system ATP-binding/permease protein